MLLSSKGVELSTLTTYREVPFSFQYLLQAVWTADSQWLSHCSKWLWTFSSYKLPRWPLPQPSNLVVTGGHWRPATELLHQKKTSCVETVWWVANAGSWEVNGVVVRRSKGHLCLQGFSWWHVLGGIWKVTFWYFFGGHPLRVYTVIWCILWIFPTRSRIPHKKTTFAQLEKSRLVLKSW